MEYRLTTPCTAQDLAPLKAGDTVLMLHLILNEISYLVNSLS